MLHQVIGYQRTNRKWSWLDILTTYLLRPPSSSRFYSLPQQHHQPGHMLKHTSLWELFHIQTTTSLDFSGPHIEPAWRNNPHTHTPKTAGTSWPWQTEPVSLYLDQEANCLNVFKAPEMPVEGQLWREHVCDQEARSLIHTVEASQGKKKNMVEFENPAILRQSNVKDPKRSNAFHNPMEGESPAHRLSISVMDVILYDPRHTLGSWPQTHTGWRHQDQCFPLLWPHIQSL